MILLNKRLLVFLTREVYSLIERVKKYIKKNSMLQKGDRVIVAVSGGPDSMCLLHLLYELKDILGIELHAAHVNHCLRGKESDADEDYVKKYCDKLGISLHCRRIDIEKYAKEKGMSSETAGREARYEFFSQLMNELSAQKIALAHNSNDQAETILMRIMRGTGLDGLRGILPVRDGIFIRPILEITRQEIENYCIDKNLNPRIDKTNLQNIYNRNKVRLELIPYIQSNFNRDIVSVLNRLSVLISKDSEFLEELSEEKYRKHCSDKEQGVIIGKNAFDEKEAIITRIIRKAIMKLSGTLNNIESVHIYDILSLQKGETGKRICLPKNIAAENIYGDIYIRKISDEINGKEKVSEVLVSKDRLEKIIGESGTFISGLGINIKTRVMAGNKNIDFRSDALTKYFDYDKIRGEIIVRTRKEGDRFIPYGMKGSKKLKDFFIDLKVPKDKRDDILLLCFGDQIAWIIGYRVSDNFKVTKETNKILEVKIRGEQKNEK